MWQSRRVCHSSKDAETLVISKMIDKTTYVARQIEIHLFGEYRQVLPVFYIPIWANFWEHVFLIRQIERKSLWVMVQEFKEKFMKGKVKLYQWIPIDKVWSVGLTNIMDLADGWKKLILNGECELEDKVVNKVVLVIKKSRWLIWQIEWMKLKEKRMGGSVKEWEG